MSKPIPEPTLQEKYDFLCSKLKITSIDLWEHDGLLQLDTVFFQFNLPPKTVDEAIINAMRT